MGKGFPGGVTVKYKGEPVQYLPYFGQNARFYWQSEEVEGFMKIKFKY